MTGHGGGHGVEPQHPALTFGDLKLGRSIELVEAPVNRAVVAWGAANWKRRRRVKGMVRLGHPAPTGRREWGHGEKVEEGTRGSGVEERGQATAVGKRERRDGEGREGNRGMRGGYSEAGGGEALTKYPAFGTCVPPCGRCPVL